MVPTEDAVALLKEALQWAPAAGPIRVYTSSIGTLGKIGVEVELQSLADYERFWNGWRAQAPSEWWERWNRVIEPGGSDEIWTVVP
jgi:hypothetical protein